MRPILTTLFILFTCVSFVFAQQTNNAQLTTKSNQGTITLEKEASLEDLKNELEGTYRIEINPSTKSFFYTKAFFEAIKAARKEDQDVTIQWDQFTTIIVFSTQSLNATTE